MDAIAKEPQLMTVLISFDQGSIMGKYFHEMDRHKQN
jgi:hypothetical protein